MRRKRDSLSKRQKTKNKLCKKRQRLVECKLCNNFKNKTYGGFRFHIKKNHPNNNYKDPTTYRIVGHRDEYGRPMTITTNKYFAAFKSTKHHTTATQSTSTTTAAIAPTSNDSLQSNTTSTTNSMMITDDINDDDVAVNTNNISSINSSSDTVTSAQLENVKKCVDRPP